MIDQTTDSRDELIRALMSYGELLFSPVDDQLLVQVREASPLLELASFLAEQRFSLVTVVGNDERELEDRSFKIYYLFSHSTVDLFVLAEYLLERGTETYPSLHEHFPGVDPFERELLDMLGLRPAGARAKLVTAGSWLHESYPDQLYPLRRERTGDDLRAEVASLAAQRAPAPPVAAPAAGLILPVGPIHAGIIEPGRFLFTVSGEAIEDLEIRLGYTHRGIERLFQSHLHLLDGWWLAEQVSGDSSFAHSLAYCHAVETLTDARVPLAAQLLRGVFLELERIHNHVADIGALADDVALGKLGSELAVIREQLLRLNARLTGHRYLRRINRPGGLVLPGPVDAADLAATLRGRLDSFDELASAMKGKAGFRTRAIGTGVLGAEEALRLGVTGLAARACGIARDTRWEHPTGVYGLTAPGSTGGDGQEARAGDVYARFLTRVAEVGAARSLIDELLDRWVALPVEQRTRLLDEPQVLPENNYTFAVGYAEGFRGDVVYWLMQDKMDGIYRCKVRDPSTLNWPALRQAVLPRTVGGTTVETVLADFPVINKSFNLSYAGNDL